MSVVIPPCQNLSLDGVRNILYSLNQTVEDIKTQMNLFKTSVAQDMKLRPTMVEILDNFSNNPVTSSYSIGISVLNPIVNAFSSTIHDNLYKISEKSLKNQEKMESFYEKVESSIQISHEKYVRSLKISNTNLKYVHKHLLNVFKRNKKSRILAKWRKITKNSRKGILKLIKLQKSKTKSFKLRCFGKWHNAAGRVSLALVKQACENQGEAIKHHNKTLSSLESEYYPYRISSLSYSKAEKSEMRQLEDLALKSDVRIMFQDIKSIIKIHTESLKTKFEESNKSITQDLRIFKDLIASKADNRQVKDCFESNLRLKAEVLDLNKNYLNLQQRLTGFDSVFHKENVDFKIDLIDRKIQAIEYRIAKLPEDKNLNILNSLVNPTRRPSTSKTRTGINSRAMSYQHG